jgi:predicted dinucleotide-binding enzyme
MKISIIGTGNMAKAIASRLVSSGHSVDIHARSPEKGEALAAELKLVATPSAGIQLSEVGEPTEEVVVLAVGYGEVSAIATEYNGFVGKTVVDITNPIDFATFQLLPAPGTSGAEEIAALLPQASVVKAFNTTFAGPLTAGTMGGKPLDVFIAADDASAKAAISELVNTSGMRAIDAGPLAHARHLEGIALIHMGAQEKLGTGWMSALQVVA